MVFELLYESAKKGELILIDGGFCRYHLRRDRQIAIHEIISIKPGAGVAMLAMLKQHARLAEALCIVAKCPADLAANGWYVAQGFSKEATEQTPRGRMLNIWKLLL